MIKNYFYKRKTKLVRSFDLLVGIGKSQNAYKKHKKSTLLYILLSSISLPLALVSGNEIGLSIFIYIGVLVSSFIIPDILVANKLKKLQRTYNLEIPDFLDRIALMLDAGLNLWTAFERAVEIKLENGPLYNELRYVLKEINKGVNSLQALENMSSRCNTLAISSFVSIIIQNSKKGAGELTSILRMQSSICRNERKNIARKMGEEATTLMLLPSSLVFFAILIMLVAPAIIQLSLF